MVQEGREAHDSVHVTKPTLAASIISFAISSALLICWVDMAPLAVKSKAKAVRRN